MQEFTAKPTLDARSATSKATRYRWVVATLFFVIYTIACADRANLGVALPFLRKQFLMNNTEAGALASMFLIAYAFAQLPAAWLVSRFGVKRVLPVSMLLTSVATGLTGLVGSLFAVKMCRVALGFAGRDLAARQFPTTGQLRRPRPLRHQDRGTRDDRPGNDDLGRHGQ